VPRGPKLELVSAHRNQDAVESTGHDGRGPQPVQARQRRQVGAKRLRVLGDLARVLGQDALLLVERRRAGDGQAVALFHQLGRLHEQRGSAAGDVVHDARDRRARLGPHRQDETLLAQGDDGLHQMLGEGTAGQVFEPAADAVGEAAGLLAPLVELGAGRVPQRTLGIEGLGEIPAERGEISGPARDLGQGFAAAAAREEKASDRRGRVHGPRHPQHRRRRQRAALLGPFQIGADLLDGLDGEGQALALERQHLAQALLLPFDLGRVRQRPERPRLGRAARRPAQGGRAGGAGVETRGE
jgi:hypothetical protein